MFGIADETVFLYPSCLALLMRRPRRRKLAKRIPVDEQQRQTTSPLPFIPTPRPRRFHLTTDEPFVSAAALNGM